MSRETKQQANQKLAEIFAKINMTDLPAMSDHVRELISLTNSSQATAYELAKAILKDYSLTNKVLRVVNSAYYSLGRPVSSISKAVTLLGHDAVRDLAAAIALFEDFIKSGVEKEGISKLLTQSFLSAIQARDVCIDKKLKVPPEEAFICALLHDLGRIIVLIYLPDLYREIEAKVAAGHPESAAARAVLDDLTFAQVGEEISRFWNLSDQVTSSMIREPPKPKGSYDTKAYLQNLAVFTNRLTGAVCGGGDPAKVVDDYGSLFSIDLKAAVSLVQKSIEASEDVSDTLRYGLSKLKVRSRVLALEESMAVEAVVPAPPVRTAPEAEPQVAAPEPDELPPQEPDKSINDFIREITETLMGKFKLNELYITLLEGLYRGVGFDRVLLGIMSIKAEESALVGRFGLGDISPEEVQSFRHPLANPEHAISRALKHCKDLAIAPNSPGAFPEALRNLTKNRMIFLLPICLDRKPIGLIYLDRKVGRPSLDESRIKAIRLFRDFAVMAIRKIHRKM